MSLINCPKCDNEISDEAAECPHCHHPIHKTAVSQVIHFIAGIILVLSFSWGILGVSNIIMGWGSQMTNGSYNFLLIMSNVMLYIGPSVVVFLLGALIFNRT